MMETGDIDTMNVSALLDRPAGAQQTGVRRSQVLLCAVTIAACVPYLLLKLLWLSGHMVGWHDTAQGGDMVHLVGNVVTLGMDLLAIVIVLVFTCRWGERIPAWLVLLPMWVATGLLAPIALGVPVGALAGAVKGSAAIAADNGLDGWVYAIVYGGFTVQAMAIEAAFVRYARARWADVFPMRLVDLQRAATYPIQRLIAVASAFVVVPYAAMFVAWGFGVGLSPDQTIARTTAQKVAVIVTGLLSLAGVAGMHLLTTRSHRHVGIHLWAPVALAWVGASSTFAPSLYRLIGVLEGAGETGITGLGALVLLGGMLAGLLMGLGSLMLLAERHAGSETTFKP
ncbi:MAG: hypothetical protein ACR2M3_10995 [Thermomicrobiales bacterium]